MRAGIESNTRRRWLHRGSAMLLAIGALPLLSVAWVARPTLELRFVADELDELRQRAAEARSLRRRVEGQNLAGRAAAYERSAQELRAVVPPSAPPFEVFHTVRSTARRAGFALTSAELGTERELGWSHGDRALRATEIHLAGRGTLHAWLELLDRLRAAGRPAGVSSLLLSPASGGGDEVAFDVTAVLETYWSAEAVQDDPDFEDPVEE